MDNKAIAKRVYEDIMSKGNLGLIDELFSEDFVDRSFEGREAHLNEVKQGFAQLRKIFPDLKVVVNDVFTEGDKAAVRFTSTGTHKAEFLEVAATNRKISWNVIDVLRFKDGKIAERWGVEDNLGILEQLKKK